MDLLTALLPSPNHLLLRLSLFNPFLSPHHISSPIPSSLSPSQSLQSTPQCPDTSLSCPASLPSPLNTCCLNHPSGHFLLAQFWDTHPPLGPNNSWTLHGLWPDHCNGGYDAYCNRTRNLSGGEITSIISEASKSSHPSLHGYMQEFWKGLHGDDDLWSHEWNKHGTCVSTLEVDCYDHDDGGHYSSPHSSHNKDNSQPPPPSSSLNQHSDLLDYLSAATNLHSTLSTYTILSQHNITPSTTTTYSLIDIQHALTSAHGYPATIKCHHGNELDEIWLHYLVQGSLRNTNNDMKDIFIPAPPDGQKGNCPKSGIRYLPKNDKNDNGGGGDKGPGNEKPFTGKGYLRVRVLDDEQYTTTSIPNDIDEQIPFSSNPTTKNEMETGCLIRQGYWYTSGQCATYRASHDASHLLLSSSSSSSSKENELFTLTSSLGPCAFLDQPQSQPHGSSGSGSGSGIFTCSRKLPVQSVFESKEIFNQNGKKEKRVVLSYKNETVFYADQRPGRFDKVRIYPDDGEGERKVRLEIYWEGI